MHKFLLCLTTMALWGPLTTRAEEPFRFGATPGKLPKDIVPTLYDLSVAPDVEKRTFCGQETVDLEVKTPTNRCVLNAKDLTIGSPELRTAGPSADDHPAVLRPTVTTDAAQETCTLTFPAELPAGTYRLSLRFAGKINRSGAGLFASTYPGADGKPETMLCTQMEPTDARRLFPCWDEPAFRAQFRLHVELPATPQPLTVVSNMPLEESVPTAGGVRHTFQVTPPMASYLVVLAAGNFEVLSGEADGTPVHVIAVQGRAQYGRYALEVAEKLLPFYNEYFRVRFPLPKLDLIAVSGGGLSGAMENWGGITFSEPALLCDPATTSQSRRQRIFEGIAHEMAHQWFGDLVTMAWWDNLWLNEGFAKWMGESAADRFNPGWQYWDNIAGNKNYAMISDARATTHPIQQPVASEMDASRAFDEITYHKGEAFIRMLEAYLGPDKFRDGLRRYMKAHAFGNTTTADLWAALSEASGQPVAAIAAPWTEQPGFPLVSVNHDPAKPGELRLSQRRFTVHDPQAAPLHWKIPVTYAAVGADAPGGSLLLDADTTLPAPAAGHPLKFNAGGTSYCRVGYDEATWRPLLARFNDLSAPDQSNLLQDGWAAVQADLGPITTYLDMVRALRAETTNPLVWVQVCAVARAIDRLYVGGDAAARTAWRQAMTGVLRPVFVRCGWQPAPNEGTPVTELRATLIEQLGLFGDPATVAACQERFAAFGKTPAALPPDIRRAVCVVVGHHADPATYDALLAQANQASGDEQKALFYEALAGATDPALAQRTLELAVRDEIPGNYCPVLILTVTTTGEQPETAARFVLANLDKILAKVPPSRKNWVVPSVYRACSDAARADELERYSAQPGMVADPTLVRKTAESIRADADLKARVLPEVNRWAKGN